MLIRNALYNIGGTVLPLLAAFLATPLIIHLAGAERYGVLILIWSIIGYAGVLDFGFSRAIARRIARESSESQGLSKAVIGAGVIWGMAAAAGCALLIWAGWAVFFASRDGALSHELSEAAWMLVLVVPLITGASILRGVLEGLSMFFSANLFRGGFSLLSYALLVLAAFSAPSLVSFMMAILLVRSLDFCAHTWMVLRALRPWPARSGGSLRGLWSESAWFMANQLVVPFLTYLDRFLIGSLIGLSAVTFYTVPYEVATKLLLLPIALSTALFPTFSKQLAGQEVTQGKQLADVCLVVGLGMLFPCGVLLLLAGDVLHAWVRFPYGGASHLALALFAAGVWFNSLAQIPNAWLQAKGHIRLTVQLQLVEFLPYIAALIFGVLHFGIAAAAAVWVLRVCLDMLVLFYLAHTRAALPRFERVAYLWAMAAALLMAGGLAWALLAADWHWRLLAAVLFCAAVAVFGWFLVFSDELRARTLNLCKVRSGRAAASPDV